MSCDASESVAHSIVIVIAVCAANAVVFVLVGFVAVVAAAVVEFVLDLIVLLGYL